MQAAHRSGFRGGSASPHSAGRNVTLSVQADKLVGCSCTHASHSQTRGVRAAEFPFASHVQGIDTDIVLFGHSRSGMHARTFEIAGIASGFRIDGCKPVTGCDILPET